MFQRALVFATLQEQRLAVEKLRGWGQWSALAPLQPQIRFAVVETDPRYQNWGLYVRLLEASRLYMRSEPAEAVPSTLGPMPRCYSSAAGFTQWRRK